MTVLILLFQKCCKVLKANITNCYWTFKTFHAHCVSVFASVEHSSVVLFFCFGKHCVQQADIRGMPVCLKPKLE